MSSNFSFCLGFAQAVVGDIYPGEDFAFILSPQPAPGGAPPPPLERLWENQVGPVYITIWVDATDKVVFVYYTT